MHDLSHCSMYLALARLNLPPLPSPCSHIMNFVNIHMFHDEDNIVALEKVCYIYMYIVQFSYPPPSLPHISLTHHRPLLLTCSHTSLASSPHMLTHCYAPLHTLTHHIISHLSPSPPPPPPPLQSPSVYSSYRRKALEFTFASLSETLGRHCAEAEPLFLYGDFNFRLDFSAVVKVYIYLYMYIYVHVYIYNVHGKYVYSTLASKKGK